MKRYALVLALVMALFAGFGCAKKTTGDQPGYDDGLTPEMRAAIQQITDGRVYFPFDRSTLAPEYKTMLNGKADLIKRYSSIRVRIEGNCDERGTQEYNLALGERRARVAYDYLVSQGVNPNQLEMVSFGKENPVASGSGESAWSQNRRDDFKVVSH